MPLTKKRLSNGMMTCSAGLSIDFFFSPQSINISRGQTISESSAPGSLYPVMQYCKGNAGEVAFDLYVNDISGEAFEKHKKFFESCAPMENDKFAKVAPIIAVAIGSELLLRGILSSYSLSIIRYTEELRPLEYTYSITLKELK